jgi:hypothetical protein
MLNRSPPIQTTTVPTGGPKAANATVVTTTAEVRTEQQRLLTVKLSGRTQALDWSRGRILSSRARGETAEYHGPLQRLLGVVINPL